MILTYPCKICGQDATTRWATPEQVPTHHPLCDTRPPEQQAAPHPKEGHLATAAHELTLMLAKAQATPDGSAAWAEFDRQAATVERIQNANLHVDLAQASQYYAGTLGWPVFPLAPGEKRPITSHGFKEATTDLDKVTWWWRNNPHANIGIPTGHFFDVVDVDQPTYKTIIQDIMASDLKIHGVASTSSFGLHLLVKPWEGDDNPGNQVKAFGPGIDYRTKGGYIVAPWSRRLRGDGQWAYWSWMSPPSNVIRR